MRYPLLVRNRQGIEKAAADAALSLAETGFLPNSLARPTSDPQPDDAILLAYTPPARTNAFQRLLYQRAWENGFAPIPIIDPEMLLRLPWPGRLIAHFHWVGDVTSGVTCEAEVNERVADFIGILADLKRQGRRIVWTMHNVLPHDSDWPEQDKLIRQHLVNAADLVHVLGKRSSRAAAAYYQIDEAKQLFAPHPLYLGAYPDVVSQSEARFEMSISPNDFVFLIFGAVEPYKGVVNAIKEFQKLAVDHAGGRTPRLVIAGKCESSALHREIENASADHPNIRFVNARIPNEDVQLYFRAADVLLCPYKRTLNSGAALLAFTYEKRVIAPAMGSFPDLITPEYGRLYDPGDPGGLLDACEHEYRERAANPSEPDWKPLIEKLNPRKISEEFFQQLRARL